MRFILSGVGFLAEAGFGSQLRSFVRAVPTVDRLWPMPSLREVPDSQISDEPNPDVEDPQGVDMWIMPYLRDSSLWPVLVVFVVHAVAFIAPVLLYAVRDGRTGPIVAVGVVALLTLRGFRWEIRSRNKFGAISWVIVATWISSFVAAYFANLYNFL